MPENQLQGASLVALLIAAPLGAQAADAAPNTVEEVVATATRATGGVAADQIGSSVTVVTAQDFEDRQIRIVSDVLRDVPGVSVSRTGAVGGVTQVRIRGTEGNHVLTLIDGIKASDPFLGEFDYATLLADDVARVEVLRGQQSALYGSDAIGGVINYITPTGAQSPGVRARVEGGSFGTFGGSARVAGVSGGLDYVLSAGFQSSDGYPVATVGTDDIGSDLSAIAAKVSYAVSDHVRLRAVVRHTETDADTNGQDFGTTGFVLDSPGSRTKADSTYGFAGIDVDLLDGRWTHSLSVQGVDAKRDNTTNHARSGGDKGTRIKGSYVTTFKLETGELTHQFTGAIDLERETFQNTAPPGPFGPDLTKRTVKTTGLVGQYQLTVGDRAGLGAAVRHDANDVFDDDTTYHLDGYVRVGPRLRLRAAAGSGVKSPSQTELFGFNASAFPFVGNPNLKPEKSKGWEIGADLALNDGQVRLGATYFDSRLKNEIFSDFSPPLSLCARPGLPAPRSCSTTGNRTTDSTQRGVELFADARLSDAFSLNAAYTHLRARENGAEEIRRPPNIASANLTWRAPRDRGSATLTVRYNGATDDTEFKTFSTTRLKAFTLVNLAGAWTLTEHIEVFGRVENLTDEDYFEVFNFRTPGRAAYAGVRARF
jgi:vitamin B12 transporter